MADEKTDNLDTPPKGQGKEAGEGEKPKGDASPLSDEDKELEKYANDKGMKFTDDTKPLLKSMREGERHIREVEEDRAREKAEKEIYKGQVDELSKPQPASPHQETFKDFSAKVNEEYAETGNLAEAILKVTGRAWGPITESNMKHQAELSLRLYKQSDQYKGLFKMEGFEAEVRKHLNNLPEHLRGRIQNVEDCIELAKGKRLDEIIDLKAKEKSEAEAKHQKLVGDAPNFASPGVSLLKKKDELTTDEKNVAKGMGISEEDFLKRKKVREKEGYGNQKK